MLAHTAYRNPASTTRKPVIDHPRGDPTRRSDLCVAPDSGLLARGICNPVCDFPLRPTYREVTACGGTFPDTVTYLRGSYTPIGPGSSAAYAAQALHLPDSGTFLTPGLARRLSREGLRTP